jgi:tetratricopeptide (TPR) repeat protein
VYSSSFEIFDPEQNCVSKFYELSTTDKAEEDDPMLIEAKNSYSKKQYENAIQFTEKAINANMNEARLMQDSLKEYPWTSKEDVFKYKSLNTVGLALLIKAKSYSALGKEQEAKNIYRELLSKYFYAQCWCKAGLFLKPALLAKDNLQRK